MLLPVRAELGDLGQAAVELRMCGFTGKPSDCNNCSVS